ncbi:MAG: hypothetical protein K2X35_14895 [Bryobacteraceae bacterium]|nr:hypothetical protein [Bryobacteraceae bacterium]
MKQILASLLCAAVLLAEQDPRVGLWKLDLAQSRFRPGPPPKSETVTVTQDGEWITSRSDGIEADGTRFSHSKRYRRDGKEHKISSPEYDTFQVIVRTPYDSDALYRRKGKVMLSGRSVVSPDRLTWTLTTSGMDGKHKPVANRIVYRRADSIR